MRQVAGPLDPSPIDRREAALARRWRGLPAGMIGVLVWAFMMSLALLFGLAFAAQLEAVRAGASTPVTGEKVNRTARAVVR